MRFFTEMLHFTQKLTPKWNQMMSFGSYFSEKVRNRGPLILNNPPMVLLYFWGSTHPKRHQKPSKNMTVKQHWRQHNKNTHFSGKCSKNDLQMAPKTWLYIGGERLGALLGHLWRPKPFFNTKSVAKVLQKWPQGSKSDPKRDPKVIKTCPRPPRTANYSKNTSKGIQKCKKYQICSEVGKMCLQAKIYWGLCK